MGGELRECGCFDGYPDPDAARPIAIRCPEHLDVPARWDGALAVTVEEFNHPPRRPKVTGQMAASLKTRRRA